MHVKTCGGTFKKIAEPEGYVDKKLLKKEKMESKHMPEKEDNKLDNFFKILKKDNEEVKEERVVGNKKRTRKEAEIDDVQ